MPPVKDPPKEATVPKEIIDKAKITPNQPVPRYSRGRVSAMGVLAELESIEPILRIHQQEAQSQLSQGLDPKIRQILPSLGIKSTNEEQFLKIVGEVSQEAARQTIEDAARIQSPQDVEAVVADSISETLSTHPELSGQLSQSQEEILTKVLPQIQDVVAKNQKSLEQAAVLTTAAQIANLKSENPNVQDLISTSVERASEDQSALLDPQSREILKTDLGKNYLKTYQSEFFEKLKITDAKIPTLQELQESKEFANSQATKTAKENLEKTQAGKSISQKIPYSVVADKFAAYFNLRNPQKPTVQPKLTFAAKVILQNPQIAKELLLAGFAHDQETLATKLQGASKIIDSFKNKRALTHKEAKELERARQSYNFATQAQAFKVKKPKDYKRSISVLSKMYEGRPEIASQQFWQSQYYFENYMPRFFTSNQEFVTETIMQSSGLPSNGSKLGSIFSRMKGGFSASSLATGMGIAQNPVTNIFKKARNIAALGFGGLLMYFYTLGQAALAGFITGAIAGGLAGAALGFLAPPILWPITVPLGFFAGGSIGGIAGGLIGYGFGSGSTTAVTTGVGAGVGGVAGGIIGGTLGSVFGPLGTIAGAIVGAYIGAAIGGAIGYAIGNYVISPTTSLVKGVAGSASSGFGIGGLLSSAAHFLTGVASTAIGAVGTAISGAFGVLSGAANLLVGGISAISIPGSTVLFLTAGPVAAVGVLSTVGIITTAASFATIAADENPSLTPGQNEFFTLTKTANPQTLDNAPPNRDVTFTITLTAKDKNLTNVSLTDTTQDKNGSNTHTITCPTELNANQNCTFPFTISIDSSLNDSIISNTVTAKATPEGDTEKTDSVTTTVAVGNPPADCPRGWPTLGDITQGPEGPTSHGPDGYEALDIGQGTSYGGNPQDVKSTVEGIVQESNPRSDPLDQRIIVQPLLCSGLQLIFFTHLSRRDVSVGEIVHAGQVIGKTGAPLGGGVRQPHLHYQFNNSFDRSFKIEAPNVPTTVPRNCDSGSAILCNTKANHSL